MLDEHELSTLRRGLLSELAYARRSAWSVVHATTDFVCDSLARPDLDRDELRACMADLKAVVATAERRLEGYERLLACLDLDPRRPPSLGDLIDGAGQTAGLTVEITWPPGCSAADFDADLGWIRGLKSHFGQVFHSVPGGPESFAPTRARVRVDHEAGMTRVTTTLAGSGAGDLDVASVCFERPG